jgi:uncharacterized protein (DUF4415 family)
MRKIVRRIARPQAPAAASQAAAVPPPEDRPPDWTDEALPMPKGKRLISLRIDADVLEYFQAGGKGYQTRMNAVLRAWMTARQNRQK